MKFFMPDWEDVLDIDFDYNNEEYGNNKRYSHEIFPEPNYDGILMSITSAMKSKSKIRLLIEKGVHYFLRSDLPIFGDCGAFSYIRENTPSYTTEEVLDYYTTLGFDYGASLDHMLVKGDEERRYKISLNNAKEFYIQHKNRNLPWVPVASIQGWDKESISYAVNECIQVGYEYIALGGLVRRKNEEIVSYIEDIRSNVSKDVKIHIFGVSRLDIVPDYVRLNVTSSDSASYMRKAFMGEDNYYTNHDKSYIALRVPQHDKNNKAKKVIREGKYSDHYLKSLEDECMNMFFNGEFTEKIVDKLYEYNIIVSGNGYRYKIEKTILDKPWRSCRCSICEKLGDNVILFRGYNRNIGRGMHNVYVYYRDLQNLLRSL